jgi:polyisoprenoid-binding protein YceI
MKRSTILFAAAALVAAVSAQAAPETYTIDPSHSTVGFKIKHFFSKVTGRFAEVKGVIKVDPDKPAEASVEAEISVKSIDTANGDRDEHLLSGDFFDATKFPAITFKSKSVKLVDRESADVAGDLTMRGITKPVTLRVKFLGKGQGLRGVITGWEATAKINRRDFGLTWGKLVEGVAAVGDEVEIQLDIEAAKS